MCTLGYYWGTIFKKPKSKQFEGLQKTPYRLLPENRQNAYVQEKT